jgi:aminopeptidase-like protein
VSARDAARDAANGGAGAAAGDDLDVGGRMHRLIAELYPICRSITGDGFRQSLRLLQRHVPLEMREVKTGTPVFDWSVPREWNVRDAWVKNSRGERVIDFRAHTLHLVSYSIPVRQTMPLSQLKEHLYSLPDHPGWIPYRTSYYKEAWGFCVSHDVLQSLPDGEYEVCVDTSLEDGHLTYGELYLPGEIEDEILISCHSCHPSLCNDNLSGMALAACLAQRVGGRPRRHSFRFLFIPGTIGSITWLALNEAAAARIKHGLVAACVGDGGRFTYKRSRRGDAEVDRAAQHALKHLGGDYEILDFSPYGYDERQYCSPGFDLPVGSLTRTPHGRFPEYHTSADNLDLVRPEHLAGSLDAYLAVVDILEHNRRYLNTCPKGEPQLGRRGLYRAFGGVPNASAHEMAMLWVLNLSDGRHSLLDIAERSGLSFEVVRSTARVLADHALLRPCQPGGPDHT